jgi:hypothetical protein
LLWNATLEDIVFAISDHLIGNLLEQIRHRSSSRIVSRNSMNHLNRIHQRRQGLNNSLGSSLIQWLNKLLKNTQVLHIILCLVQLI